MELHGTFSLSDLEQVMVLLPAETLPIVAEPAAAKERAATEYEAKFSAQFVVAKALLLGRFTLAELTPAALSDAATQALAMKVSCRADPQAQFPRYYSGSVSVVLKDGCELERRILINKGAGPRALSAQDIEAKFLANASLRVERSGAQRILDAVMSARPGPVRGLMQILGGNGSAM
jgi:2-methylcitrate dehydratase PrpD